MAPLSSSTREVVVVGGGPAGAATALGLVERGIACTLLERSDYSSVTTLNRLGAGCELLTQEQRQP